MNEESTHFPGVHFLDRKESIMLSVKQLNLSTNKSEFFGLNQLRHLSVFRDLSGIKPYTVSENKALES